MTPLTSFPTAITAVSLLVTKTAFGSGNGTGIDLQDYEGLGLVVVHASLGTDADETLLFHLEDSPDDSTYTDIATGVAASHLFTSIEDDSAIGVRLQTKVINVNQAQRYLRIVSAVAGTTPAFSGACTFYGIKKQR